ncbi:MAG: 2TM domain-containing protein [Bacteroidota bacterium]
MDTSEFYNFEQHPAYYKKAKKIVRRKRRWYRTTGTFAAISLFLIALNLFTESHEFWAIFPILGMSLASAISYIRTFGIPGIGALDEEWQERHIYQEMRKMRDAQAFQEWLNEKKNNDVFDFETENNGGLPDLETYPTRKQQFNDHF